MTPLIAMYINRGVGFDPAQYTWMDMSVLPEDFNASEMLAEEGVLNTKMHLDKLHLPFPNTALVVRKDEETVLTITTRDEGILVEEWGSDKEHVGTWTPEKGFVYHPLWAQAARKHPDKYGTAKDFGEIIASRIAVLEALMLYTFKKKRMVHGYNYIADKAVNDKRKRKGKKPLYEWRTIEIKPSVMRSNSKGGTHASPRSHDVRGHWSVSKLGKRYWVKSHKRGDSAKGTIFHDYVTGGLND
jgi:hypothetical protein